MSQQRQDGQGDPLAVNVERADEAILEVFVRLLQLLERLRDLAVLGRLIEQQLVYHLVGARGGATLAAACLVGSSSAPLAKPSTGSACITTSSCVSTRRCAACT